MSHILNPNILNEDLRTPRPTVIIGPRTENLIDQPRITDRLRSPYPAKDLPGFYNLVRQAIIDMERREETPEENKIFFSAEEPDFIKDDKISIVFSLVKRQPGAFGKGRPFEADVLELKPHLREEIDDPAHPGYKQSIFGICYDNEIKFTIFARTNKRANQKVEWFENLMMEYDWFFGSQGIPRLIYFGRQEDFAIEQKAVKIYGRPVHYFVRTEKLITISQKVLEQIEIGVTASENGI